MQSACNPARVPRAPLPKPRAAHATTTPKVTAMKPVPATALLKATAPATAPLKATAPATASLKATAPATPQPLARRMLALIWK